MSKTNFSRYAACVLALAALQSAGAIAQAADVTISDLAAAQKIRLNDEILKARGLPTLSEKQSADIQTAAAAASAKSLGTRSVPVRQSSFSVHGIYTRGIDRVVELTDGRNLYVAKPGARYGSWTISTVNDLGVVIAKADCKKKCGRERQVVVGGSF